MSLCVKLEPFNLVVNRTRIPVCNAFVFTFFFSSASVEEENPEFWRSKARASLQSVLDRKLNTNVAKNIVFFLGDGKNKYSFSLLHSKTKEE